jgi:hypothetical protein
MLTYSFWIFSLEDLILLPLVVFYAIWWDYDLRKGAEFSRGTTALHIFVYLMLAVWVWLAPLGEFYASGSDKTLQGTSFFAGIAVFWFFVLPILFLVAIYVGYRFARSRLVIRHAVSGAWIYTGAIAVPVIWFVIWLVRLLLEDGLLHGYSVLLGLFENPALPAGVSARTFLLVVTTIAVLYIASFGAMIGFSGAVWGRYRAHRRQMALTPGPRGTGSP